MPQAALDRLRGALCRPALARAGGFVGGRVASRAVSFLSVPILTRIMSPEDYGTAAVAWTWAGLLALVGPLNLGAAIMRGAVDREGQLWNRYLATLTLAGLALLVFEGALIALLPRTWLDQLFGQPRLLVVAWCIAAAGLFLGEIPLREWAARVRARPYVQQVMAVAVAQVVLSVMFVAVSENDDVARVLGLGLPLLAAGIIALLRLLGRPGVAINAEDFRDAAAYGAPLVLHGVAGLALGQLDRVMIGRMIGSAEAGFYTVGYQLSDAVAVIWAGANAAWVPWLYHRLKNGDVGIARRRSAQYGWLFTLMVAVLMPLGSWALPLFAGERFAAGAGVVPPVIAAQGVLMLYSFYVNIEMYDRRNFWVASGTMAAALINLLLNLWALPRWGWEAAAWTTLGSYGALLVVHAALTVWKFGRGQWVPHAHVWAGALVLVIEATLLHVRAVSGPGAVP